MVIQVRLSVLPHRLDSSRCPDARLRALADACIQRIPDHGPVPEVTFDPNDSSARSED